MQDDRLVVYHTGVPMVILDTKGSVHTREMILDWYAEVYAFDRTKLQGYWLAEIEYNKLNIKGVRRLPLVNSVFRNLPPVAWIVETISFYNPRTKQTPPGLPTVVLITGMPDQVDDWTIPDLLEKVYGCPTVGLVGDIIDTNFTIYKLSNEEDFPIPDTIDIISYKDF